MFDRFRAFSLRQQVFLALGTACAALLVLGMIWFFLFRTAYMPLFTQLRPADAATIVADLERRKISYRLENGGATILVPEEVVDSTRLDVMSGDLPLKGTVGFELFNKSDVGLTDFAQKINYQRALQGELERTIMTLDGIESARVHLSLGEDRIFRDDRVPPKASVTIRLHQNAELSAQAAGGVQRLVAASVPDLDASDVVIIDEEGHIIGAPEHVEAAAGTGSPEAQEKTAIEQYYQATVRSALERAYPQLGITVAVVAGTNAADPAALPDWNTAARSFPLQVTLSEAATLDLASRDGVRALVAGIIRSNATVTDTIQFATDVAPPAKSVAADLPHPRAIRVPDLPVLPPEEDGQGEWRAAGALFALLLVGLGTFYVLAFRARRPKRLTDDQRAMLSTRLRAAMVQGDANAARP